MSAVKQLRDAMKVRHAAGTDTPANMVPFPGSDKGFKRSRKITMYVEDEGYQSSFTDDGISESRFGVLAFWEYCTIYAVKNCIGGDIEDTLEDVKVALIAEGAWLMGVNLPEVGSIQVMECMLKDVDNDKSRQAVGMLKVRLTDKVSSRAYNPLTSGVEFLGHPPTHIRALGDIEDEAPLT